MKSFIGVAVQFQQACPNLMGTLKPLIDTTSHKETPAVDEKGKKIAVGRYVEGVKHGRWMFWSKGTLTEVEFEKNIIKNVKKWNNSELVYVE